MPSISERQRRFFGAEYGRAKAGKKPRTGMSTDKLREFASGVKRHKSHGSPYKLGIGPQVARRKI